MDNDLTKTKKIRYDWLDAIKAFAILLVIFGHLGLTSVKDYQAYASFIKLPLFFAASGFVFNPKKTQDVGSFVVSRIKRILLPYLYCGVIVCIANFFLEGKPFNEWLKDSAHKLLTGDIFLWFLPVLFLCNLLMLFAFKLFKNKDLPIIITAVLLLAAGYFALPEKHILFDVNVVLIAYPFCIFGYYYKKFFVNMNKKLLTVISVITLLVYIAGPSLYKWKTGELDYINMFGNYYTNYFWDMLIAFCGTLGFFILFSFIKFPKSVVWFGQNTLYYYAFHIPLCSGIVLAIHHFVPRVNTDYFKSSPKHVFYYCIVTVFTLIVMVPICFFVNKYIPFIVGNPKPKKKEKK